MSSSSTRLASFSHTPPDPSSKCASDGSFFLPESIFDAIFGSCTNAYDTATFDICYSDSGFERVEEETLSCSSSRITQTGDGTYTSAHTQPDLSIQQESFHDLGTQKIDIPGGLESTDLRQNDMMDEFEDEFFEFTDGDAQQLINRDVHMLQKQNCAAVCRYTDILSMFFGDEGKLICWPSEDASIVSTCSSRRHQSLSLQSTCSVTSETTSSCSEQVNKDDEVEDASQMESNLLTVVDDPFEERPIENPTCPTVEATLALEELMCQDSFSSTISTSSGSSSLGATTDCYLEDVESSRFNDIRLETNLDIPLISASPNLPLDQKEAIKMARLMEGRWETMLSRSTPLDPLFKHMGINYIKRLVVDKCSIPVTILLEESDLVLRMIVQVPFGKRNMRWRLDGGMTREDDPDCGQWDGRVCITTVTDSQLCNSSFRALRQQRTHRKIGSLQETRAVLPDEVHGRILYLHYALIPSKSNAKPVNVVRILKPIDFWHLKL